MLVRRIPALVHASAADRLMRHITPPPPSSRHTPSLLHPLALPSPTSLSSFFATSPSPITMPASSSDGLPPPVAHAWLSLGLPPPSLVVIADLNLRAPAPVQVSRAPTAKRFFVQL
jgi:hypothetical protein